MLLGLTDTVDAQSRDDRKVQLRYYENPDPLDPGVGYIVSPEDAGPNSHNFVFCAGGTAHVDIENLIEVARCPEGRHGPWPWAGLWSVDPGDLEGAHVYASDFTQIGEIVSIGASGSGTEATIEVIPGVGEAHAAGRQVQVDLEAVATDVQKTQAGEWSVVIRDSDHFIDMISGG